MTMAKNFASKTNDCKMYSILLEYNLSKNIGQEAILTFTKKYPMLNINYLDESIKLVEEILGFGISETSKCYNDMNGTTEINRAGCKPLYKMVQEEYIKEPTQSPITLCWLWHPLVYGVHYQDVIKLPSQNLVKKLSTSYTGNKKELIPECMSATFSRFPIFPPLSQREQNYIKKNIDSLLAKNDKIDTIILACTHYPLLINKIKNFLPEHIKLLSQGEIVANSLSEYLQRHPKMDAMCTKNGNINFYTTDSVENFNARAADFYGKAVNAKHIEL